MCRHPPVRSFNSLFFFTHVIACKRGRRSLISVAPSDLLLLSCKIAKKALLLFYLFITTTTHLYAVPLSHTHCVVYLYRYIRNGNDSPPSYILQYIYIYIYTLDYEISYLVPGINSACHMIVRPSLPSSER